MPLPVVGTVNVLVQTDMRAGPGLQFPVITQAFPGMVLNVSGRTADNQWFLTSTGSWVQASAVTNAPANVPITEPTPTPLPNGLAPAGNGSVFVDTAPRLLVRASSSGRSGLLRPADDPDCGPQQRRSLVSHIQRFMDSGGRGVTNAPAEMPVFEPTPTPFGTPPPTPTALIVGPSPTPTATFPPPPPSATPSPTVTPAPALTISSIDRNQDWVIIFNQGGSGVDLNGWTLAVEGSDKRCPLQTILAANLSLRVWAGTGASARPTQLQHPGGNVCRQYQRRVLPLDPAGQTVALLGRGIP